jgi:hypothetical protein
MDATVPSLPRAVLDYIAAFVSGRSRSRGSQSGRHRSRMVVQGSKAGPAIREATRHTWDIPAATRALGVAILSRAGHSFRSWSKRTTSNEAKNNNVCIIDMVIATESQIRRGEPNSDQQGPKAQRGGRNEIATSIALLS